LQTWKTTRHTHKAGERSNLSGSTTQPTTNHFLQASTKPKAPTINPRSIFNCCKLYDHEGESFHKFPEQFHAKK